MYTRQFLSVIFAGILILATVLFLLLLITFGCSSPKVTFTPKMRNGGVEFNINPNNINGFIRMTLWEEDTRKKLWDINLNYYPGPVLKYGVVPDSFITLNGVKNSAEQNYPNKKVIPKPIPQEKNIEVRLTYQYDTFMSPSVTSKCYVFKLKRDGVIVDLGEKPCPLKE